MPQIEKLKAKLFEKPVRNDMTFAEVEKLAVFLWMYRQKIQWQTSFEGCAYPKWNRDPYSKAWKMCWRGLYHRAQKAL